MMLDRAKEALYLCNQRNNNEIYLLWSGGIDTTAMVCSFLQLTEDDEIERQRIVIRYTERSVAEYPAFFDEVIVPRLRHCLIEGHVRDVFNVNDDDEEEAQIPVVVTGDPADMLFGTFRMFGAIRHGEYSLNEPWQKRAPMLLHERRLLLNANEYVVKIGNRIEKKSISRKRVQDAMKKWVEWMTPQVKKSPIPIVNMFDWWWWVTYSLKYNHDVHRIYYNREQISSKLRERVFNFYESEDFHQYSFASHNEKMKDLRVWATYKYPLKKFILDYCKKSLRKRMTGEVKTNEDKVAPKELDDHDVYFYSKIKVPSVANSFGMEVGIDSEWNVVKFGAASISRKALKHEINDEQFINYSGKEKINGDKAWANGDFETAKRHYARANRVVRCDDEVKSCAGALNRARYNKAPKFIFDEKAIERHQVFGLFCHLAWDDNVPISRRGGTSWVDAGGGWGAAE